MIVLINYLYLLLMWCNVRSWIMGQQDRPGQGFWVYGISGHFNSGIWYFLVKIRV